MTEWEREEKWVKAFGRMNYYACTECCQCLLIIPIGELYLRWGGWIEFIGAWGRRRECWIYIIFYEPAIESNRRTTGLVPYFHVQPINIWGFRERPHSISSFSSLIWHCPLKSKSFPSIKWYWLGLGFPRTHFSFFSVWCESVVFLGLLLLLLLMMVEAVISVHLSHVPFTSTSCIEWNICILCYVHKHDSLFLSLNNQIIHDMFQSRRYCKAFT